MNNRPPPPTCVYFKWDREKAIADFRAERQFEGEVFVKELAPVKSSVGDFAARVVVSKDNLWD